MARLSGTGVGKFLAEFEINDTTESITSTSNLDLLLLTWRDGRSFMVDTGVLFSNMKFIFTNVKCHSDP